MRNVLKFTEAVVYSIYSVLAYLFT